MTRVKREEIKGNILKRVTTRIDFQDMFEVTPNLLRLINKICNDNGIENRLPRLLESDDFESNDKIASIVYPYEYIKDIKSTVFYNEKRDFVVEVNQLFLSISQKVDTDYRRYGYTLKIVEEIIKAIESDLTGGVDILRVSLKKANEVFYDDITNIKEDFQQSILGLDQPFNISWTDKSTKSIVNQNFKNNDTLMNVKRLIDNGINDNKELIRLYIELEAYSNERVNETSIVPQLEKLNNFIFDIFESIFTDKGIDKLKYGERMGSI